MKKTTIKLTNNVVYGINGFLVKSAQENRTLGTGRAMFCLSLLQSELTPIVETIDKLRKPPEKYIEYVQKSREDGADIEALEEEYKEEIAAALKQDGELAELAAQEVEIDAYKINIDEMQDLSFAEIKLLSEVLEL